MNIHDIVEEWQQNGFVFNVFPIVFPDHPDQFKIGKISREGPIDMASQFSQIVINCPL